MQLLQQTQRMELAALVVGVLTHGEQKENNRSLESASSRASSTISMPGARPQYRSFTCAAASVSRFLPN
jgi:hypothetical protein